MNEFDAQLKALVALNDRVQGLLEDGFHVLVNYKDQNLCLVKLIHHNGKRITVKLDRKSGELSQYSNNVLVFFAKMY